jgi:BCD family chlorophyll transporter-like MFS transporter
MPTSRLIRIGLRQFAAGMLSILSLGILNRIMKVEMGLELGLVSLVIGAHYFAAPLAIPLGHQSDRRPLLGFHRSPYILFGAALTAAMIALIPFSALYLARTDGSLPAAWLAGVVFFLLGVGMFSAGTAYLSLVSDLTIPDQRGRSISIIWSMMMLGILAGVFLGVGLMERYTPGALIQLFQIMAALLLLLTVVAVVGQESPGKSRPTAEARPGRTAWRLLAGSRQTRLFFIFLLSGILFLFLQQVVLEPFGGDVFGMSVRQTTLFNAYQMIGVLGGMAIAGRWLSPRLGDKTTAAIGLLIACASFALLGGAGLTGVPGLIHPAIVGMGLGMGLFNVGGLALMIGMATTRETGLFMGIWTLAQAIGNGTASVGGGLLHDLAMAAGAGEAAAYSTVFLVEAGGLLLTLFVLRRLSLASFQREAASIRLLETA